ncbi:GNAT family N-acetyltransferase [Microbacterium sp. p3-SID336]|uniref:GNAT family N-acetyltransferase n=1 Tax=Microbacterium sp. p3-SID336 TaxID=2916212 RepID=UPI0021A4E71A|nr:GNAT family N-acetyltransferase [Microbacterium sp. p3-SID336]MCT1478923.1 N-acetyltransferase [Microbacterium sp. p3-SID336]
MTDITVTRHDDASRYEIRSDDVLAGYAEFQLRSGAIRFIHTEIDPAFQGQGLAGKLASAALADAVDRGEPIVPLCPYIAKYLQTHEVPGAEIRWPQRPADVQGGTSEPAAVQEESSAGDEDPTGRAE